MAYGSPSLRVESPPPQAIDPTQNPTLPHLRDSDPPSYSDSAPSFSPRASPGLNTDTKNPKERIPMHLDVDINHSKAREGWSVKKLILAFITSVLFVYTILHYPVREVAWHRIYWGEPVPAAHCTSYGIRKYTARLCNAPMFYGRLEACEQTPIVIHNKTIKTPDRCDDQGIWSGMYGTWFVNFDEMACLPFWGDFVDEGCTTQGSRLRRTKSRLWNIQQGDDWMQMCATTPADLHGVHFDSPKYCDHRGVWGIYGVWELEDLKC